MSDKLTPWRKCEIHVEVERGGICGSCAMEHAQRSAQRLERINARSRSAIWLQGWEAGRSAAARLAESAKAAARMVPKHEPDSMEQAIEMATRDEAEHLRDAIRALSVTGEIGE